MASFTIIVFVVLALGLLALFALVLCALPGDIAAARGNPNREAINVCSWMGLIIWPLWVVAIIWAHTGEARESVGQAKEKRELTDAMEATRRANAAADPLNKRALRR